jgi:type II secretory pathway pseudopilin PulG
MSNKAFTLLEIIIIIAVIAILAAFIILGMPDSRGMANDAVRKNDISNIYKSIVGKQTINGITYPSVTSTIEEGKTNTDLQSFIGQFLSTTPYDPDPSKAYLYKGNGTDFSVAAFLEDGSCFIKSTGPNLFGSDAVCSTYSEGGIGLVQDFMLLHGSTYLDLTWSIPASLSSVPSTDVSSAIVCIDSTTPIDDNSLPTDEYMFTNGTVVAVVNNAYNQYRITVDNPDYYYYCKSYSYDNTVITNPGTPGSSPNTGSGGFSSSTSNGSSNYSSGSPSSYNPSPSSNPPSPGGSTSSGGSSSPSFTVTPTRNPDGTGSITLSWRPGALSTHTIIRRQGSTPPALLTDGVQVYDERNDKDGQDPTDIHTYTDTGLSENTIYCYSAWAYDERTNKYSNGFVLACGGVPPSDPSNLSMNSTTSSFNLSFTKGSSTNTVIRRTMNTPATSQEEGTIVYNGTDPSFTDNDPGLLKNTTYCYSLWSYNPTTAALSTNHVSSCGTLSNMAAPTNLTFPTVAYNSIILNWTKGLGTTSTVIVRKQESIPSSRTDGTQIYSDTGNAFIDTGLTDNTNYCYALYGTDGVEYTEPLTGCQITAQLVSGVCGTANKVYASNVSTYGTDTFCSAGYPSPSSPSFPASNGSISWTCVGTGGNSSCNASRGTVVYAEAIDGSYKVETFTLSANATASVDWVAPVGVTQISVLVVAGGGGGGDTIGSSYVGGGGGGGGGVIYTTKAVVPNSIYRITVGAGGTRHYSGVNSVFGDLVAIGGGAGGSNFDATGVSRSGLVGGSGGGASHGGTYGVGTSGQGYRGGSYYNSGGGYATGGGGGAGAQGMDATAKRSGNGGNGLSIDITGTAKYYGGGGGGFGYPYSGAVHGTGGLGGGGNNQSNGTPGTGGGGGGGYVNNGGTGGSGIVIVRYLIP